MVFRNPFRNALLQERDALERRLRQINTLLQSENPQAVVMPPDAELPSRLDAFAESVGLEPTTVRLLLVIGLVIFLWARGRAVAHAIGVITVSVLLTTWASTRQLLRYAGVTQKSQ